MSDSYLVLKSLHVLGVVTFLDNIIVTAYREGIASYEIVEFVPSTAAPRLASLKTL